MATSPGYFIREALTSFRRNWVMSLVAVITIYLSLLLVGTFVFTGVLVTNVVSSIEKKVSITIYLKDAAAEEDVTALQSAIQSDERTTHVNYVSKSEALERFRQRMKESPEIIEQIRENNPLPASLEVELRNPKEVRSLAGRIKSMEAFARVIANPQDPDKDMKFAQDLVDKLFALTRSIRIAESVFIVMLGVVSLVLIGNTIRLAIYARRREIGIMRLVGASNWFIRLPFLLEGLTQALIGATLAVTTLLLSQAALLPKIRDALPFLPLTISGAALVQIAVTLVVSGVLIGLAGSGVALRRYLRV